MKVVLFRLAASLLCAIASGMVLVPPAGAEVVLQATRVIVDGKAGEAILRMKNEGNAPSLVQVWADEADGNSREVPFVLTPTLFRLDAGSSQSVRIVFAGDDLPGDRESLFWLNVLDVPPKSQDAGDRLQIALRSRIKLIWRPAGLPKRSDALDWTLELPAHRGEPAHLRVVSHSPYIHNFSSVSYRSSQREEDGGMGYVLPFGEARFELPAGVVAAADGKVAYVEIDDYGGGAVKEAPIHLK